MRSPPGIRQGIRMHARSISAGSDPLLWLPDGLLLDDLRRLGRRLRQFPGRCTLRITSA